MGQIDPDAQYDRTSRRRLDRLRQYAANFSFVYKKIVGPLDVRLETCRFKQRIANGKAFDVLAKKSSTCPSGKRGGDLGEVRPGQRVGAIDAVIFKKPLRVVHGPIKSKFGYHLVQVFYRD